MQRVLAEIRETGLLSYKGAEVRATVISSIDNREHRGDPVFILSHVKEAPVGFGTGITRTHRTLTRLATKPAVYSYPRLFSLKVCKYIIYIGLLVLYEYNVY